MDSFVHFLVSETFEIKTCLTFHVRPTFVDSPLWIMSVNKWDVRYHHMGVPDVLYATLVEFDGQDLDKLALLPVLCSVANAWCFINGAPEESSSCISLTSSLLFTVQENNYNNTNLENSPYYWLEGSVRYYW